MIAAKDLTPIMPKLLMVNVPPTNSAGVSLPARALPANALTSALMASGAHLGAAVLPLSLAARVRRGPNREIVVEPRNSIAALVAKFRGRLFILGDLDAVPGLGDAERGEFLSLLNRAFDGKVEAVGWGHDGPAIRAMLKANALPHQEAFLVGSGIGHRVLGEAAGLPLTKDIDTWLSPSG